MNQFSKIRVSQEGIQQLKETMAKQLMQEQQDYITCFGKLTAANTASASLLKDLSVVAVKEAKALYPKAYKKQIHFTHTDGVEYFVQQRATYEYGFSEKWKILDASVRNDQVKLNIKRARLREWEKHLRDTNHLKPVKVEDIIQCYPKKEKPD